MIILSIVCVLLAGALLALLSQVRSDSSGGSQSGHEGEPYPPGGSDNGPARRSPFPYDHEQYPGSV